MQHFIGTVRPVGLVVTPGWGGGAGSGIVVTPGWWGGDGVRYSGYPRVGGWGWGQE